MLMMHYQLSILNNLFTITLFQLTILIYYSFVAHSHDFNTMILKYLAGRCDVEP